MELEVPPEILEKKSAVEEVLELVCFLTLPQIEVTLSKFGGLRIHLLVRRGTVRMVVFSSPPIRVQCLVFSLIFVWFLASGVSGLCNMV